MTAGSRVALRRYSNCNLHWRVPILKRDRPRNYFDPPPLYNRQKLYITEDAAQAYGPDSRKFGRDRTGPYVWTITDCGWEWLATRPGIHHVRPLYRLFDALHDHVHTKHREDRMNAALMLQRAVVRLRRSTDLDERWGTDVYPDAHSYWIRVRFSDLSEPDAAALEAGLPGSTFNEITLFTAHYTTADWREQASSPHHAMRRAQRRLRELGVPTGGTFWENPVRLKIEETA